MRLTVLIVDDEPLAREGLKRLVSFDADVGNVHEARNGREAVVALRDHRPDLVLLDVQMPRMDGFAVIDAVGADRMPEIIFVTAHDQYAIRAFEISAVDYLLKPVTEERFRTAFTRAKRRLGAAPAEHSARQLRLALDTIASRDRHLTRLAARDGDKTVLIAVDDVEWIDALQNYVRLHVGRATYLLHVPLSTLEAALDPARFVRIHRSHIVNVHRIRQAWPFSHGQYVVELASGHRLQSGRTYGEKVRGLLTNPF
jgi:two-component system, LytTR family, response regulator